MIPLLSRKSIVVLAIGLILGSAVGMGYWHVSPVEARMDAGWPPFNVEGLTDSPPPRYQSSVTIEPFIGSGVSYASPKAVQRSAEYWAYRLQSSPFLDVLARRLAEQGSQYAYSRNQLRQMLRIKILYEDLTTKTRIDATGESEETTVLLVSVIPLALQDFLFAEELQLRLEQYNDAIEEIGRIKPAQIEAKRQLTAIEQTLQAYDLDLNPKYVAANARSQGLQVELNSLSGRLAESIGLGLDPKTYKDVLTQIDRTSTALADTRAEVADMAVSESEEYLELSLERFAAQARLNALDSHLKGLMSESMRQTDNLKTSPLFTVSEATIPEVVPADKIEGRKALLLGSSMGLGISWVGLNFKGLVGRMKRPEFAAWHTGDDDDEQ